MSLYLGSIAPDFTAQTTQGPISFHEWSAGSWVVFFSHPRDFTPVCTTELASAARLVGAFATRGAKVLALSVDTIEDHRRWIGDIEETQGIAPDFPIIDDFGREVATAYGMIPPGAPDAFTVRSVYFIDPAHKIRATLAYPASTGRSFEEILRVLDSLQLTDTHKVATPADWRFGDDVVLLPSLTDPTEIARRFPRGVRVLKPWLRLTPQPNQ